MSRNDGPRAHQSGLGATQSPNGHSATPWTLNVPQTARWLNSNDRLHRMAVAKITKHWRDTTTALARHHGGSFTERVRITVTIHKNRAGRYDAGNLYPTAKACVDGLVSAGVLVDDSNEYVEGPDMRHGAKDAHPHLTITIERNPS